LGVTFSTTLGKSAKEVTSKGGETGVKYDVSFNKSRRDNLPFRKNSSTPNEIGSLRTMKITGQEPESAGKSERRKRGKKEKLKPNRERM